MEVISILLMVVLLATLVLSGLFLLSSWATTPKKMEHIPGSLGWPIVGESFSFLSDFASPSGIYSFVKERQLR